MEEKSVEETKQENKSKKKNALLGLGNRLHEVGKASLHLLDRGDTGRVNVVESGTDEVRVSVLAEGIEKLCKNGNVNEFT